MPKPYAKLNREDLQQAPIWEWVPDDGTGAQSEATDESCVRPTPFAAIPGDAFAQFIVAATFGLRDGSVMPGIAEVTVDGKQASVQPTTLLLLDRHLRVPGVETNRLLSRYTKTIANHPTSWELNVRIDGEATPRSGKIEGGDMKDIVAAGLAALESLKALRK